MSRLTGPRLQKMGANKKFSHIQYSVGASFEYVVSLKLAATEPPSKKVYKLSWSFEHTEVFGQRCFGSTMLLSYLC